MQPLNTILITRPQPAAGLLAGELASRGWSCLVRPPYEFSSMLISDQEKLLLQQNNCTVIFTSPRAVEYGLAQLNTALFGNLKVAAVGEATAQALIARLGSASNQSVIRAEHGFTSEALLDTLGYADDQMAVIITAPDGRKALASGLLEQGWQVETLFVYRRVSISIEPLCLQVDEPLLCLWTSGTAMTMTQQALPQQDWEKIVASHWLVISPRLAERASEYGVDTVTLASGPDQAALLADITALKPL